MENASRALVMAGGVLIALMILGALVLLFSNLSNYQMKKTQSEVDSQIADFNNQFEPYNKDNLTLMELKSVYNKIESNNAKNPEYKITHNISSIYSNIANDFKSLSEEDKQNRVFKCTGITYGETDGRISAMNFQKIK